MLKFLNFLRHVWSWIAESYKAAEAIELLTAGLLQQDSTLPPSVVCNPAPEVQDEEHATAKDT